MAKWRCPNCRAIAGVPVRYGLPTQAMAEAAARREVVLGGAVLSDDDPHRCCLECRAALWPAGVFAVPGAADPMRVVLVGGRRRRLEASIGPDGGLVLVWRGTAVPETQLRIDVDDLDLLSVVLVSELMDDGRRLMRWLSEVGIGFVGDVRDSLDRCVFTEDGCVTFSGVDGDLLLHGGPERLLLQLLRRCYRREGYRSIAELHGWISGIGLDIAQVG